MGMRYAAHWAGPVQRKMRRRTGARNRAARTEARETSDSDCGNKQAVCHRPRHNTVPATHYRNSATNCTRGRGCSAHLPAHARRPASAPGPPRHPRPRRAPSPVRRPPPGRLPTTSGRLRHAARRSTAGRGGGEWRAPGREWAEGPAPGSEPGAVLKRRTRCREVLGGPERGPKLFRLLGRGGRSSWYYSPLLC